VAEFALRARRRIDLTLDEARRDVFDYVEAFYNRKRKHGYNHMLPPVEYERRHFMRPGNV
jgi:putative transposase